VAAACLLAGFLSGCGAQEECGATTVCSQSVNTCCTDSSCYYEFNGNRVNCNGTDCSAAANQVANSICRNSQASENAQKLTFAAAEVVSSGAVCRAVP